MTYHPSKAELTRAADGETSAVVAAHLESCTACRETVAAQQAVATLLADYPETTPPASLHDRIRASRAAGVSVLLSPPTGRLHPRRWSRPLWAAAAATLGLGIVLTVRAPELASSDSELIFSPNQPQAGDLVNVEYRSGGRFAGHERVVLRARFRPADLTHRSASPAPVATTSLVRSQNDRFHGAILLPANVGWAGLVIEDSSGDTLDTNNGALWELLVHRDGTPLFEGLYRQLFEDNGRNSANSRAIAHRITELYPDRPEAWFYLGIFDNQLWGAAKPDSLTKRRQDRFRLLDDALRVRPQLSAQELWALFNYAVMAQLPDDSARWGERLLQEAPRSVEAINYRVARSSSHSEDLQILEGWWSRDPSPDENLLNTGIWKARRVGDAEALVRWTHRRLRHDPSTWPAFVLALLSIPDSVDVGLARARSYLAADPAHDDRFRPLRERTSEHAVRVASAQSRVRAAVGRALIGRGQTAAGTVALERAADGVWNQAVIADLAALHLQSGDSGAATSWLARIAVDPAVPQARRDSAAGIARRYLAAENWNRAVSDAHEILRRHVFDKAKPGPVISGTIEWKDPDGRSHNALRILQDNVTVLTYWWVRPTPNLADMAAEITALGGKVVAMAAREHESADSGLAWSRFGSVPVYRDPGYARRGFEIRGFPYYVVFDHTGRIRFSGFIHNDWGSIIRQVAVLVSGEKPR